MDSKSPARKHRVHSAAFKAQVLAECRRPGASVAAVAIGHGLNPNVVHKWLAGQGIKRMGPLAATGADVALPKLQFVPVALAAPAKADGTQASGGELRLHIEHGAVQLTLCCPADAAGRYSAALGALLDAVAAG
ncbi:MAG: transposase [Burkholderiales bacterium]|nr:transposase [Burkholderiales bacterium]